MTEIKEKKHKNSFHLRIYDVELLKSLNELLATEKYESMNELLNCALGVGVEKIYLEFGKRKLFTQARAIPEMPDGKKLDKIENKLERQRIMQEDMFILLNSIEALVASVFNVQRAQVTGESVSAELIDSGYMAKLPAAYLEIKDNLVARFNRKLEKEKKPE
ncbi:MAG: hypothetical protein NC131_19435 [Roseburia sp.]|nr:hypothetical protein [Roseburia sp.]